jgi:hypothetical protein
MEKRAKAEEEIKEQLKSIDLAIENLTLELRAYQRSRVTEDMKPTPADLRY